MTIYVWLVQPALSVISSAVLSHHVKLYNALMLLGVWAHILRKTCSIDAKGSECEPVEHVFCRFALGDVVAQWVER